MAMGTDPAGGQPHTERLDADAVCAECGMVNPEETLICKQCGNNLREQRQRRLAAEQQMTGEAPGEEGRKWLAGALTAVGLLLILWTAFNRDSIMQYLISAQGEDVNPAEEFWRGAETPLYRNLLTELRANIPTPEQKEAAFRQPAVVEEYEGYYVIVTAQGETGDALLRPALVGEGTLYDFVALINGTEVRGRASLRDRSLSANWNSVGIQHRGNIIPASGVVIQQPAGGFDGFAQSPVTEGGVEFKAYKIGAVAAAPADGAAEELP